MEKKSLFSTGFFLLWTWEFNTPGGSWKDPIKQGLPVFHSVCPGVFLSCAWQPNFLGKKILPQKSPIYKCFFLIYWKVWSLTYTEFFLQWKFAVFLRKSHIWEKFCFWNVMFCFNILFRNILSQSDCRIF